jgi:hypothetical protein
LSFHLSTGGCPTAAATTTGRIAARPSHRACPYRCARTAPRVADDPHLIPCPATCTSPATAPSPRLPRHQQRVARCPGHRRGHHRLPRRRLPAPDGHAWPTTGSSRASTSTSSRLGVEPRPASLNTSHIGEHSPRSCSRSKSERPRPGAQTLARDDLRKRGSSSCTRLLRLGGAGVRGGRSGAAGARPEQARPTDTRALALGAKAAAQRPASRAEEGSRGRRREAGVAANAGAADRACSCSLYASMSVGAVANLWEVGGAAIVSYARCLLSLS